MLSRAWSTAGGKGKGLGEELRGKDREARGKHLGVGKASITFRLIKGLWE